MLDYDYKKKIYNLLYNIYLDKNLNNFILQIFISCLFVFILIKVQNYINISDYLLNFINLMNKLIYNIKNTFKIILKKNNKKKNIIKKNNILKPEYSIKEELSLMIANIRYTIKKYNYSYTDDDKKGIKYNMLEKLKNLESILYELYNSNIYDINLFEKANILINEINKEKIDLEN